MFDLRVIEKASARCYGRTVNETKRNESRNDSTIQRKPMQRRAYVCWLTLLYSRSRRNARYSRTFSPSHERMRGEVGMEGECNCQQSARKIHRWSLFGTGYWPILRRGNEFARATVSYCSFPTRRSHRFSCFLGSEESLESAVARPWDSIHVMVCRIHFLKYSNTW